jgi:hypothetical protein
MFNVVPVNVMVNKLVFTVRAAITPVMVYIGSYIYSSTTLIYMLQFVVVNEYYITPYKPPINALFYTAG